MAPSLFEGVPQCEKKNLVVGRHNKGAKGETTSGTIAEDRPPWTASQKKGTRWNPTTKGTAGLGRGAFPADKSRGIRNRQQLAVIAVGGKGKERENTIPNRCIAKGKKN